jgi:hypothetical protein
MVHKEMGHKQNNESILAYENISEHRLREQALSTNMDLFPFPLKVQLRVMEDTKKRTYHDLRYYKHHETNVEQ